MKKVWLGAVALLLTFMCITSCVDDDDTKASAVSLDGAGFRER